MNLMIAFAILANLLLTSGADDNFQLELAQILFRHGDRTPSKIEIYKNDPYDPSYYEAFGYGQLTPTGMERMYKTGQFLENRYGSFVGNYRADKIYAYSTDSDRTKMSLQLVLAGLFPPSSQTRWNEKINWFPIPTNYERQEINFLSKSVHDLCFGYLGLVNNALTSPEIMKEMKQFNDFVKLLENKTGLSITRAYTVHQLYNNIKAVKSFGLPLPDWCSEEVIRKMEAIERIFQKALTHTEVMRKIFAGPILERFLQNVNDNGRSNNATKLYLYSAHDLQLIALTRAHNFVNMTELPEYGSALIFEKLRGKDNQVYIRILFRNGVSEKLLPLQLKHCSKECPLKTYLDLTRSVVLYGDSKKCSSIDKNKSTQKTPYHNHSGNELKLLGGNDADSFKYAKEFSAPLANKIHG